jgi:hypothetical protein
MNQIIIDHRFRGTPDSGNGGYVCGRVAHYIDGAAEITLRAPAPLDTRLDVVCQDQEVSVLQGENLVATGRSADIDFADIPTATFVMAEAASARTPFTPENHAQHECFVCGPGRQPGDGLRIEAGPISPTGTGSLYAAPWVPGTDLVAEDGLVAAEFVWSVLDCPTGYVSLANSLHKKPLELMLLGRMAARIDARPQPGEKCVITAWQTSVERRKYFAEAALYNSAGAPIAVARATWIKLRQTSE